MEQVKAPEKIFLHPDIGGREFIRPWLKRRASQESVEYTRTDAFIEKACFYIKNMVLDMAYSDVDGKDNYNIDEFIEDFKKYLEE